jgi:NADH:flavin oxidoreductase / NADH oxidase family
MKPFVTPRALELGEIAGIVEQYRVGGANAQAAGFDGVEIHAARSCWGRRQPEHVSHQGPIKLTGWQWSSTPGKQAGEGWALDFGDGGRPSVAAGDSGLNRALYVRRTLLH